MPRLLLLLVAAATVSLRAADHVPTIDQLLELKRPTAVAMSPDGTRIAFTANRRRDPDLTSRDDIHVVDVATRTVHAITAGPRSMFTCPTWMPDGSGITFVRVPGDDYSQASMWAVDADGSKLRSFPDGP